MELCPPEIWLHIFTFACVDGGCTSHSLSLVSRFFCDVSYPTKNFSIALRGPEQMVAFASTIEYSMRRSPVRHLLLEWKPRTQIPPADFSAASLKGTDIVDALCSYSLSRDESAILHNRVHDDPNLESKYIKRIGDLKQANRVALKHLIPLVSGDLHTLSAAFSLGMHIPAPLWSSHFPNLRELTIFGCSMIRLTPVETGTEILFPSLRYLHLIDCTNEVAPFTTRAPNLTHLRLSSVGSLSRRSRLFQSLESLASGMLQMEGTNMILPWSMRRVILQGHNSRPRIFAVSPNVAHDFGIIIKSDTKDIIRILDPIPPTSMSRLTTEYSPSYQYDDVVKDWEERMMLGQGCWLDGEDRVFSLQHSEPSVLQAIFGSRDISFI